MTGDPLESTTSRGEMTAETSQDSKAVTSGHTSVTSEEIAEYRQFQEFRRLNAAAQAQSPVLSPASPTTSQGLNPPPRLPRWAKRFAGTLLSLFLLLIALIIGGKLLYNYFFPSSGNSSVELAKKGGGTYHTNDSLPTSPYEAVRAIYDFVHRGDPLACTRFTDTAKTQFATDLGFTDCAQAINGLHPQVTDPWAYAFSIPSYGKEQKLTSPVSISSCSYPIEGGPSLGTFTLTQVERGQWLITGHQKDSIPCPPAASTP